MVRELSSDSFEMVESRGKRGRITDIDIDKFDAGSSDKNSGRSSRSRSRKNSGKGQLVIDTASPKTKEVKR